jgi:16S rRNA (cytosine967-C5)-methyltransferase
LSNHFPPKRAGKPVPKQPATPPVQNLKPISPSRSAAFAVLERVGATSAHSDDLLHAPAMSALSQVDRNLATTLVMGVLRWQIALDAKLQTLLQRPDQVVASPVATALRLGAFQLLHLDRIPPHAALSESVELVRAAGHGHAAGMVNAILRNLQRQAPAKPKLFETTPVLAERLAHPTWLVERWVKNYGRAEAIAICEYDQREPSSGELFQADDSLPRMDDGSRLVAELAALSHAQPQRIWDCCAAPGGKTLVLAQRHPEAELLATDANPKRLQALAGRLKEAAPKVRTFEADAGKLPDAEGLFDLILCDVPCSGTGTLVRNPEIKERLQPSDLARQAVRQREILTAALARLGRGGRLLYSTCSLEPEENERVVEAVLNSANAHTISLEPILNQLETSGTLAESAEPLGRLLRDGKLRTLPGFGFQGDGFFATLFERV